jgi:hypothetical protein
MKEYGGIGLHKREMGLRERGEVKGDLSKE